jgi:biopolymer transport protein ExbD
MQRNHARYRGRNDINIVPMLDVMVILTFFLIFTAVFSKTSVVEVNLPGPAVQAPPTTPTLELEVILRRNGIEVADRNVGVLETIALNPGGRQDVVKLTEYLAVIKGRFPDKTNATLLVEDDVDYDTIVQVMDSMRVQQSVEGSKVTRVSLFPLISLGDAPK